MALEPAHFLAVVQIKQPDDVVVIGAERSFAVRRGDGKSHRTTSKGSTFFETSLSNQLPYPAMACLPSASRATLQMPLSALKEWSVQPGPARLGEGPEAVHRASAEDGRARQLRFRHQLRQRRFREALRAPAGSPRRSCANLGLHRNADQRQEAKASPRHLGYVPESEARPPTRMKFPIRLAAARRAALAPRGIIPKSMT